MSLTPFQRRVCRLLAQNRIDSGESYAAGGAALNEVLQQPRVSGDLDLFHDSHDAVARSWESDRRSLTNAGYSIEIMTERPSYVEAAVKQGSERVELQWAEDSAYRFFPLAAHLDFGLTLHPFDLATNKVLALVGRLEVRDWIDVIACCSKLQPLGYLAWAASGKDAGLNPTLILDEASRSSRYTRSEVESLSFEGPAPDAGELSRSWRQMLAEAHVIVDMLPGEHAGDCVMHPSGELFRAGADQLGSSLDSGAVRFHSPVLRGAFPTFLR